MKKSLRRIKASLMAMTAVASFAAAPLANAGVTFELPSLTAFAADGDVLVYESYLYKVTDDGIVITAYSGTETELVIPSAIDETPVTSIGGSAFKKNTAITAVTIPETVTSIGKSAFNGCSKLEKLTLNEGLTTLGEGAFCDTKISSIYIPSTIKNVTSYGGPFRNCESLNNVTFG
ncbi:MAG: leucine-rich repeat protein, partial [Ruminococcus sp.]|nr:leucine-rich repeat protein [Ruminococcus sp.]